MDFEWNIFPGFNTLQLSDEFKSLLLRLGETPENFTGRIIFMSMFNDISRGSRDNEEECKLNAKLVSVYAKRCGKGQWSFIGPGSEKKWYCISEDSPQGEWDNMAERMLLEFAESGCPIYRATTPLSRGRLKSKGHGKLSIHFAASGKPECDIHKHHKSQKRINVMENIDSVPSNVQSSRQEALLYVFEDNEAVIKMIIKGRSPTMRHVSRTHRVALDWLFDRINLDSKIQIKYIDTKNQLADMSDQRGISHVMNGIIC